MRSSTIALLLAAAASVVAQDLSQLPSCAQGCLGNSIATSGCGQLDIKCICSNKGLISGLACCVAQSCPPQDQQNTINFANSFCAQAGVTTLPQSASCPSTAAPAPAPGPSTTMPPMGPAGSSTTSSAAAAAGSPMTSSGGSSGTMTSGPTSMGGGGGGGAAASSSQPTSSGNAADRMHVAGGMFGGAVVGAVGLLL